MKRSSSFKIQHWKRNSESKRRGGEGRGGKNKRKGREREVDREVQKKGDQYDLKTFHTFLKFKSRSLYSTGKKFGKSHQSKG